jgi:hypothetical protein
MTRNNALRHGSPFTWRVIIEAMVTSVLGGFVIIAIAAAIMDLVALV